MLHSYHKATIIVCFFDLFVYPVKVIGLKSRSAFSVLVIIQCQKANLVVELYHIGICTQMCFEFCYCILDCVVFVEVVQFK